MGESVKEIIIITESADKSTEKVFNWFYFFKTKVIKKNVDCDCVDFNVKINSNFTTTSLSNSVVWHRRGYLPIISHDLKKTIFFNYLKKEQLPVLYLLEQTNSKNYLGSYFKELNSNKFSNLKEAVLAGFKIPETIVTNNKINLLKFINQKKSI